MRLKRLIAENFRGWRLLDVGLGAYTGVTSIIGKSAGAGQASNGVGKSSMLMAVSFALYGDKGESATYEDLKKTGSDDMRVALHVVTAEGEYIITRRRNKHRNQTLSVIGPDGKAIVDGWERKLGLPPLAVWENTVYAAQDRLGGLITLSASARKDVLTDLFGLSRYLTLETKAREQVAAHERAAAELAGGVAALEARLQPDDGGEYLAALTAGLAACVAAREEHARQMTALTAEEKTANEKLSEAQASVRESEAAAGELAALHKLKQSADKALADYVAEGELRQRASDRAEADLARLTKEYATATQLSETALALQTELAGLRQQQDANLAETSTLRTTQAHIKTKIDELANQLNKFVILGDGCPVCGSVVGEDALNQIKNQTIRSKESLAQELQNTVVALAKLNDAKNMLETRVFDATQKHAAAVSAKAAAVMLKEKIDANTRIVSDWSKAADTYAQRWQALQDAAHTASARLAELNAAASAIDSNEAKLRAAKAAAAAIADRFKDLRAKAQQDDDDMRKHEMNIVREEERRKTHAALVADIERNKTALNEEREHTRIYGELVRAFGPGGIPDKLLSTYISELQEYLDRYINALAGGRLRMYLRTSRTSRTGKVHDSLYIDVEDALGIRDITTYSGGERVRMHLALRLALAKLIAVKFGAVFQTIMIDEVQYLDEAGAAALMEVLDQLSADYAQVFVVSHVDNMKDSAANMLVLDKDHNDTFVG